MLIFERHLGFSIGKSFISFRTISSPNSPISPGSSSSVSPITGCEEKPPPLTLLLCDLAVVTRAFGDLFKVLKLELITPFVD
jgi:hypothetical protein